MSAPLLYQPDVWWLAWLHNLSQATFPAAFLHFGLTFPEERPIVAKHPTWIGLPYLLSVALTVWMMADYYATPPDMTPYYVICVYSAVAIVALVGLVAYAYWENRAPSVRPRLEPRVAVLGAGDGPGRIRLPQHCTLGRRLPDERDRVQPDPSSTPRSGTRS